MFDLWAAGHSVLREKVLERVFLTELSRSLLLDLKTSFEVLRSEFDAHGYDVVVEARGVLRHIQLKATRTGGKRTSVDINLALADKPGGCVVWFTVDPDTLSIGPFYFLGGRPGERMPALEGRIVRHSKANSAGQKADRPGLREVARTRFKRMDSVKEVASALFGCPASDHAALLSEHLAVRGVQIESLRTPATTTFEALAEFGHLIDGYGLAAEAGLGDPFEYANAGLARANLRGRWEGSALELWVSLFLEYRRDRFGGVIGFKLPDGTPLLDALCRSLVNQLEIEQRLSESDVTATNTTA